MRYKLEIIKTGKIAVGDKSIKIIPIYDNNGNRTDVRYEHNSRPEIGSSIFVGTSTGNQSYDKQITSGIVESIIYDTPNQVTFTTRTGDYIWTQNS